MPSSACMCFCAGIRERIGYNTKGRGFLLTQAIEENAINRGETHDVDYFLGLLDGEADNLAERRYRFYVSDDDRHVAKKLLDESGIRENKYIVLNPGANWIPKRWSPQKFSECADLCYEQFHLPIVITGSQENEVLAQKIMSQVKTAQCFSMCGKTTLTQVGALFSLSACVVTADSGPMHIASGVGASVVTLFGPTEEKRTGPYGIGKFEIVTKRNPDCSVPCYEKVCSFFHCMENITAEMVVNKVADFIQ